MSRISEIMLERRCSYTEAHDSAQEEAKAHSLHRIVSRVELAILANGGGDYDEKACECDASVNQSPCRYCAIRDALNEALRYLKGEAANDQSSATAGPKTP